MTMSNTKFRALLVLITSIFGCIIFILLLVHKDFKESAQSVTDANSIILETEKNYSGLLKGDLINSNESVDEIVLPHLDHKRLIKNSLKLEDEGIYRFAYPREVDFTPETHGRWKESKDYLEWDFVIKSEGAESINLGFTDFNLPEGAALNLTSQSDGAKPVTFTSSDNDRHRQLWTPLFWASAININLSIPREKKSETRLHLTKVNHGFRSSGSHFKISANTSGTCQIDVICSVEDNSDYGPIIDIYRDQIRSVGAYTIEGIDTCSGALVNNTNNDLRPYFLTAEHCGITNLNAASVVVYWNHENSTCRPVGTSLNGRVGDGRVDQFNTGSILRAKDASSDFCLIELDDPVDLEFMPFFAGWNRSPENPDSSVGIHHPGVSEKRISIELQPTSITDWLSDTVNSNEKYLRIPGWDFGLVEPGSSGSPLFDDAGLIVGQLTGGYSDCNGQSGPDYYGRFYSSWEGGGTSASRLSDWLDPSGTGVEKLEGIYADDLIVINGVQINESDSGTQEAELKIEIRNPSGEPVSVRVYSEDGTANVSDSDYIILDKVIDFTGDQLEQSVVVEIIGDSDPEEHETFFVHLSDPVNALVSSIPARVTILNDDYIIPEIKSPDNHLAFTNQEFSYQVVSINTPTEYSIEGGEPGMSINSIGKFSWMPIEAGNFDATIIASNPAGNQSQLISFEVTLDSIANGVDLLASKLKEKKYVDYSTEAKCIIPKRDELYQNWNNFSSSYDDSTWITSSQPFGAGLESSFLSELVQSDLSESFNNSDTSIYFRFPFEVDLNRELIESANLNIKAKDGFVVYLNGTKIGSQNAPDDLDFDSSSTIRIDENNVVDDLDIEIPSSLILPGENILAVHGMVYRDETSRRLFEGHEPTDENKDETSRRLFEGQEPIDKNQSSDFSRNIANKITKAGSGFFLSSEISVDYRIRPLEIVHDGWSWQQSISNDGDDAIQTDNLGNDESASISIKVTGPDIVYFWWKVSSESGYDFFRFLVDGEPIYSISGEVDWEVKQFNIPEGEHELKWVYSKDGASTGGLDKAWLDTIAFASQEGPPQIVSDLTKAVVIGSQFSYRILTTDVTAKLKVSALPSGINFDGIDTISGTPTSAGDYVITITADNGEVSSSDLKLKVISSIDLAVQSPSASEEIELVKRGSEIKFLVPEDDSMGSSWLSSSLNFDDSSWKSAIQPIGFESKGGLLNSFIETNIEEDMKGVNSSSYLRIPFDLDLEGKTLIFAKLELKYDDGYVAYINGNEVSRVNAPEDLNFSSRATKIRTDNQVVSDVSVNQIVPEVFNNGENILAIHGLNIVSMSSDFLVDAKLNSIVSEEFKPEGQGGWQASGANFWFPQFEHSKDLISAAQSGEISDNEESVTSLTVNGPATVSFWWKVSSENYSDYLTFSSNGQIVNSIAGQRDWEPYSIELNEGEHILSWSYSKDGFGSEGFDAGWIDGLTIVPGLIPQFTNPSRSVLEIGDEIIFPIEIINGLESFGFENLPDWLTFDEESNSLKGTANLQGQFNFQIWAENPTGRNSIDIQIFVAAPLTDALDYYGFSVSSDSVINDESSLKYLIPLDESLGDQWKVKNLDDSSWKTASQPLGFESSNGFLYPYIRTDISEDMKGVNASGYFRYVFESEKPIENLISATLKSRIDDGLVAYLNGVELIAFNAPEKLEFNSNATGSRRDSVVISDQLITPINKNLLIDGLNVLAIQAMNSSVGSSDFLLDTELELVSKLDSEGEAIAWKGSGDNLWFPQNTETYDEVDAVRSGDIEAGETSIFSTTFTGPATVSFWWKVSSDNFSDYLSVSLTSVGNERVVDYDQISGEVDWTQKIIEVPEGEHLMTWAYAKDGFGDSGQDAGWVDMISFEFGLKPKIEIAEEFNFYLGDKVVIPIESTRPYDSLGFEGLPDWLIYDESISSLVGTPLNVVDLEFEVWAENSTGRFSANVRLRALPSISEAIDFYGLYTVPIQLINSESEVKFLIPESDEFGINWTGGSNQFDDSSWNIARQPVGFESPNGILEPLIETNISSFMKGVNSSGYFRYNFDLNLTGKDILMSQLEVMVDDGCIAYLNGVEIGRANVPDDVNFDSKATISRNDNNVIGTKYVYNVSPEIFVEGENILAVQAMNRTALSSDFILDVNLRALIINSQDLENAITWEGSGDALWFSQGNTTHDGQDAVRSGDIGPSRVSTLSTKIAGPSMISFWWKVSSEQSYDYLSFLVDGVPIERISGEVNWTEFTYEIDEGEHTISWTYSKDGSGDSGQDAGWIDQFRVTPGLAPRAEINSNYSIYFGSSFSIPINFINEPDSSGFEGLPDWLVYDPDESVLAGVPPNKGTIEFTVWAENSSGRFEKTVTISVVGSISEALDSMGKVGGLITPVGTGAEFRYSIPVDDSLGMEWIKSSEEFDESSWGLGVQPIGFETLGGTMERYINTDIGAAMKGVNSSGYFRTSFELDVEKEKISGSSLEVMIDDGYVAYFNGIEIGRQNVPNEIKYDSRATASRNDDVVVSKFFVDQISPELFRNGENVLALQAMNRTKSSSDFILGLQMKVTIEDSGEGQGESNWQMGGDSEWLSQGLISHDGLDAAKSGNIGSNEESTISTTINGPASVSFWWKVSSEQSYDYLSFFVDGVPIEEISGEINWNEFTHEIGEGEHTISWTYSKDGGGDAGQDAGWLDQVLITPLGNSTPNTDPSSDLVFDAEWVNVSDQNDVLIMEVSFLEGSISNPPNVSFDSVAGCVITIFEDGINETARYSEPTLNFISSRILDFNEDLVGQLGFIDFNFLNDGDADYGGFDFFMIRQLSTGKEYRLQSMLLRNQEEITPLQVRKKQGSIMSLVLRTPEIAQRVKITKSYDTIIWEPSNLITDENSEWLERPNEGWSDRREILLPDDFIEEEKVFFRLEYQE